MDKSFEWWTYAFVERVHYKIFINLHKMTIMLRSGHEEMNRIFIPQRATVTQVQDTTN